MKCDPGITIREAVPEDVPEILSLIRELAGFERMQQAVVTTEEHLFQSLFVEKHAETLMAEYNGESAGFALFYHSFSSWLGRSGLYLDDLYVRPDYRKKGIGRALFRRLAVIAHDRNCGRFEWSCPDWSASSIAFYRSLGAVPMNGWTDFRLEGDQIRLIAEGSTGK